MAYIYINFTPRGTPICRTLICAALMTSRETQEKQGLVSPLDFGSQWNTTRRDTLKEDHPEKTSQKILGMANSEGTTLNVAHTSKSIQIWHITNQPFNYSTYSPYQIRSGPRCVKHQKHKIKIYKGWNRSMTKQENGVLILKSFTDGIFPIPFSQTRLRFGRPKDHLGERYHSFHWTGPQCLKSVSQPDGNRMTLGRTNNRTCCLWRKRADIPAEKKFRGSATGNFHAL